MTTLPDYKSSFPAWKTKNLGDHVAGSTAESVEMLAVSLSLSFPRSAMVVMAEHPLRARQGVSPLPSSPSADLSRPMSSSLTLLRFHKQGMLVYDPAKRMSAKAALKSDYFRLSPGMRL